MSPDLATEPSALRILVLTAKDDITHTREAYSHDDLATRVFDKKLIKKWGSKPVDIVTGITYMEVVDTGTPLSEVWVSIHTGDLDLVGTNKEILDKIHL